MMKILLTGATGYIGQNLLPALLQAGHHVVCCVRDASRFDISPYPDSQISVVEVDFLEADTLHVIPNDIEVAYYLLHSMATSDQDFEDLEIKTAMHFKNRIEQTNAQQVIYLSGIVNESHLSKHLQSRKKVEETLSSDAYGLTTLRAGIIVGAGSASFEIIRDLVEKLPVMITPKWLNTKSQPIAIKNVIEFLTRVLGREDTFGQSFDIGGPEILSYKQMLLIFAKVRDLNRFIFTVPVMTPRLSSYWLFFVTSTSYSLAVNLVDSMKVNVICRENDLAAQLDISQIPYEEAIRTAFRQNEVPVFGCYKDARSVRVTQPERVWQKIWSIGGDNGWYFADGLWKIRGLLDHLVGGPGLRRGRRDQNDVIAGDAIDFWRVQEANATEKRLVLKAEMKLPGETWLEFKIDPDNLLHQTVTFQPLGLWGRFYWFAVWPLHHLVFSGMLRNLTR